MKPEDVSLRVKAFLERVRKGIRLLEMMHADQDTLRAVYEREGSKYYESALKAHGWSYEQAPEPVRASKKLNDFLCSREELTYAKCAECYVFMHDLPFIREGVKYQATDAKYSMVVDTNAGVIQALLSYSPKHMIKCHGDEDPDSGFCEPVLHHWSDFAYMAWEDAMQVIDPFCAPRFIMQDRIQNDETERVLDMVMKWAAHPPNPDYQRPTDIDWPGVELTGEIGDSTGNDVKNKMAWQAFAAVIGTVHGAGAANLLIDRKEEFGILTITKVNVMVRQGCYDLLFHVEFA